MATINGKALVKDGEALDRVYSNGQLVYGRNLLYGTRDFSGTWTAANGWVTDGAYKGLTVKKRTERFAGIYKTFTAPKNGVYAFSAYVKSLGDSANVYRLIFRNGVNVLLPNKSLGSNFDWLRDSFSITLEAGDTIYARYEMTGTGSDLNLWNAGHKWELCSTATPWTPAPEDYI